jgi:CRP/FNR family transcriptional regulator
MESNNLIFRDAALRDNIFRYGRVKQVAKDKVLIAPGDEIVFLPIVLKGILRIIRQDTEGREIFLYHLYPGQTCAMAINCCQANKKSMVKAVAEDDTEVMQIPVNQVEAWLSFPEWKTFINNTYASKFTELLEVIDLIAFNNMDKQLLHYLNERAKALNTRTLEITHQQIADELHTHREAISRLLRTMEQKNMVRLGRNAIELLTT